MLVEKLNFNGGEILLEITNNPVRSWDGGMRKTWVVQLLRQPSFYLELDMPLNTKNKNFFLSNGRWILKTLSWWQLQHIPFMWYFFRVGVRGGWESLENSCIKATNGFHAKWLLRNERRNSILKMWHYPYLGSASNWMTICFNRSEALLTRHEHGFFSKCILRHHFAGKPFYGVTKWRLIFSGHGGRRGK